MSLVHSCDDTFNLVSVDPGSALMGVAVFGVRLKDRRILSAQASTWEIEKIPDALNLSLYEQSSMVVRLNIIRQQFKILMHNKSPLVIVYERPFFNRFTPGAYGALIKVLESVQITALDYNPNILIQAIEPMLVKKRIGASLNSDKETVRAALLKKEDLKDIDVYSSIPHLGKDAIDALAIGYTYIHHSKSFD